MNLALQRLRRNPLMMGLNKQQANFRLAGGNMLKQISVPYFLILAILKGLPPWPLPIIIYREKWLPKLMPIILGFILVRIWMVMPGMKLMVSAMFRFG